MRVGRGDLKVILLRFVYYGFFLTALLELKCQFFDGCYLGWFMRGLVFGPAMGLILAVLATVADRPK